MLRRVAVFAILLCLACALSAQAASRAFIPNAINVRADEGIFVTEGITTSVPHLATADARVKSFLASKGAVAVRKVFPKFDRADTLYVTKNGDIVRLIDLSQFYTIEFSDTVWWENLQNEWAKSGGHGRLKVVEQCGYSLAEDIIPNDPQYMNQPWLYSSAVGAPRFEDAWEYTQGSSDVKICIIDDGIDYNHDDLSARVVASYRAQDGSNYAPPVDINDAHGTAVAGIVAAITDNAQGVAGANWNSQIYNARAAEPASLFGIQIIDKWYPDNNVAACLDWARAQNVDVINMSFGFSPSWLEEVGIALAWGNALAAACYNCWVSGQLLVASKGNEATTEYHRPSDLPTVLGVASCNLYSGNRSSFSNYGPGTDLMAVGEYLYTTAAPNTFASFSGTSAAAPVVTAAASLLKSYEPELTADEIEQILELTAERFGDTAWSSQIGWGIVKVDSALKFISKRKFYQMSSTSYTKTLTWDTHKHVFATQIAFAKQYRCVHHFDFSGFSFEEPPLILFRDRAASGWSAANPNNEMPWARVVPGTLTASGCDIETYAYYLEYDGIGYPIDEWRPCDQSSCPTAPDIEFQITVVTADNCPFVSNPGQEDSDGDYVGDVCDNCPTDYNPDQLDDDEDGIGNLCDLCPGDTINDPDGDSICFADDNCPYDYNPGQENADGDIYGDVCDNCPFVYNDDQADDDNDGLGDLCDTCPTPDLIFPNSWGSIIWADDSIPVNLDWECTYAPYYQVEIYEIQRDTIDDVNSLTDPVVQDFLDTCTFNMWRDLPVYMDVYNWSSFYWRVRAGCDSVGWSEWSEFDHYKVYVTTPHLSSPANGEEIEYTEDITLTWHKMPCGGSYRVQVDDNSDFSSPVIDATSSDCPFSYCRYEIDPQLPNGKYYWRVYKVGFGDWSYTRYFRIVSPPVTSCPVLFSYDGDRFVRENPLLTACEASNYTEVVTDYYQVTQQIRPRNGMITFQLKELEDEITYLEEFELVSVDHRIDTKVGCSVDGRIFTYREAVTPLSAVDHNGIDRLAAVSEADDALFVSDEPGYLIVTFPASQDEGFVILNAPIKLPCPFEDPGPGLPKVVVDPDRMAAQVTVELLDSDGQWVTLPDLPSRQDAVDEIVLGSLPSTADGEPTTVRISWPGGFATDRINQYLPADEIPNVNTWGVSDYRLDRNQPTTKAWAGFGFGETLVMKKGDVLEAEFNCGEVQDPDLTRDYIVRAVGRYQPDYAIFTGLVPGAYQLYDAYPNPFNPVTTISYDLPAASEVRLEVYNLLGQKVATLVDEFQNAGHHSVQWSMANSGGESVASGVYFYRITAGDFSQSKKLILLK